MEEKKQSDIKIETVKTSPIDNPRTDSDSIVISQKGKNTRNIPSVLFIV